MKKEYRNETYVASTLNEERNFEFKERAFSEILFIECKMWIF